MTGHAAILLQLFAIGVPWTLIHCPGMCGPLLFSLRFGMRPGLPWSAHAALADLMLYQCGRLLVYGCAGAAVGACGAFAGGWRWGAVAVSGFAALVLLGAAAQRIPAVARRLPRLPTHAPVLSRMAWVYSALSRLRGGRPLIAAGLIGMVLAALPCGIAIWALALAAATASPFAGAMVMAGLVVMTALPLGVTVMAPGLLKRGGLRAPLWLVPACLILSAALMLALAVGAARAEPGCPLCQVHHG